MSLQVASISAPAPAFVAVDDELDVSGFYSSLALSIDDRATSGIDKTDRSGT